MMNSDVSTCVHSMKLDVFPGKISEEQYKRKVMKQIKEFICGLINSGGGKLRLLFKEKASHKEVDNFIKIIEQLVGRITPTATASYLTVEKSTTPIDITVPDSDSLVTLSTNLYLPQESQVVSLPPNEPVESIKKILEGKTGHINATVIRSHSRPYIKGKHIGFEESKNVQLKLLKDQPSEHVTIAKRISHKSNELHCYVSAFANHTGGHIYFGVDPEGIVSGEQISKGDKEEILKEIKKVVNRMVWPDHISEPKRGMQWDVFFEPVKNELGLSIPSVFVIIVFIASCPGGVFTENPESYHILNGKVEKIGFQEWLPHFQSQSAPASESPATSLSENIPSAGISAGKQTDLSVRSCHQFKKVNEKFINLYDDVTDAYKENNFEKADAFLNELETLCRESPVDDCGLSTLMAYYVRRCVLSAKKQYVLSYTVCQLGFVKINLLPANFMTVQLYLHAAMLTTVLFCGEHNLGGLAAESLRFKAVEYLQCATRDLNDLKTASHAENPNTLDVERKLNIYKASVYQGCSLSGEIYNAEFVSAEDVDRAAQRLNDVYQSITQDKPLANFRKTQFLLAHCDLSCRRHEKNGSLDQLRKACKLAEEAKRLTEENNFFQMKPYAIKRLTELRKKLT